MKNIIKAITLLTSLIIVLGLSTGCAYNVFADHEHDVNQELSSSLDGSNKIDLDAIASEINVVIEPRDDVSAVFEGHLATSSSFEPTLEIKSTGNTMLIQIDYGNKNTSIGSDNTTLTVYIPDDYSAKLSIQSISGDINIDAIDIEDLIMETISGRITGDSLSVDYLEIKSISGDIELDHLDASRVEGNNISGDITLNIPEDYYLDATNSSVSGDIHTEDGHSDSKDNTIEMDLSTISGDININRY